MIYYKYEFEVYSHLLSNFFLQKTSFSHQDKLVKGCEHMESKLIKVLSKEDLKNLVNRRSAKGPVPITINKDYTKNLKTNLLTPSRNQSYSCCVEWITKWFLSKFPDDFFKQKFIDMEHLLKQRMDYKTRELLTTNKPAVAIRASLDHSYNRELLDQYNYGDRTYSSMTRGKELFFRDRENNLGIGITMEMLLLNFSFRMVFAEQAIQMDVGNRCNLVFRANATQKHYVDVDYHIPDELLVQLAEDTGNYVCPCSGKIVDAEQFVKYFNQHSQLPIYYKFDASKGNMQYFLRMPRCLIHIRTNPIDIDEGDNHGNLHNNFKVSFDCQVRFPSPKFYAYLSIKDRSNTVCISQLDTKSFGVIVSSLAKVPDTNSKGWPRKLETMYSFNTKEEKKDIQEKKLMSIDFKDMIGDLRDAIELTKSRAISPNVFLDLRVYNYYKEIPIEVDWYKMRIDLLYPLTSTECCIVLYIDSDYYMELIKILKEYEKTRIQPTDTQYEHRYLKDKTISPDIPNGKVVEDNEFNEYEISKKCLLIDEEES